jgi:flavocytochrome c
VATRIASELLNAAVRFGDVAHHQSRSPQAQGLAYTDTARQEALLICSQTKYIAAALGVLLIFGCSTKPATDANIIVVGAGIAGLSAALEAADRGATVLVLDANSVGGGHAVKAGGFALVGTALQKKRGYEDSPAIAYKDLMTWGETANAEWVERYVGESNVMVYEWLRKMGVEFKVIIPTPEATVPRFHFTAGTAINAVVPMMDKAFATNNISFQWNEKATELLMDKGRVAGVKTRNERNGSGRIWRSTSVILATGGFQNNLAMVRQNWKQSIPAPDTLLKGAGQFAIGDGYLIAAQAGADMHNMDRQVTFVNGLPDPRDTNKQQALTAHNDSAIWINAQGIRFVNETAPDKVTVPALLQQKPASMWIIFDKRGLKRLQIRGASWLNRDTIVKEIINNPQAMIQAHSIDELAAQAGLPQQMLATTIDRYNGFVGAENDPDFGRFESTNRIPAPISEAPFYALNLYPLTRKSMGGPVINSTTAVLDANGTPIAGLFAAGELTGVAGINGSHGGSGTFLGPSVFMGRVAGQNAALEKVSVKTHANETAAVVDSNQGFAMSHNELRLMTTATRPGYWHFEQSHGQVLERMLDCEQCHSDDAPMHAAQTSKHMAAQLQTCTLCH